MAPKKRTTPFQRAHELQYALRITQRDTRSSEVVSVECLFCVHYGRESKVGSKRKKSSHVKFFTKPFRPENYRQHHLQQHPARWMQYEDSSDEEKKIFFEGCRPVKQTLHRYFGGSQVEKQFLINAPIVNTIIGEMLWDPDDVEGVTYENMMKGFEDFADSSEQLADGEGGDRFRVVIKNPVQFNLAIDYLRVGCSFRQASRIMHAVKERTGLAAVGACSDATISKYARYACAINLQKISEVLADAWTFAIALDMSTHMSTSYLDIRIRLHLNRSGILNWHILAVPIYERHTAEAIFEALVKLLDVLCPDWRAVIVGISTDGERKMTGRTNGVATLVAKVAKPGFIRVWCGAHQLDLVLQDCYVHFGSDQFYSQLTALISYLRRQKNLIADMRSKAPKVADTRWESMGGVSLWFKLHRVAVDEHLHEKKPACTPPPLFWAQLMVVQYFSHRTTITFKEIQGHDVTVGQQRSCLNALKEFLLKSVGGIGPLLESQAASLDTSAWTHSSDKRFAGSFSAAQRLVLNQGSFVLQKLEDVPQEERSSFFEDVANLFVEAAARIDAIVVERNSMNEAALIDNQLPSVLPHELAVLEHIEFCSCVREHRERMAARWTNIEIDAVEQEHQALVAAFNTEPALKSALLASNSQTTFDEGWAIVKDRFKSLQKFCGGLASVFPGTSQVEGDFSVIKFSKNDYKKSLTDFALEGLLHSKQYETLAKL